jgi:hypothetical protein
MHMVALKLFKSASKMTKITFSKDSEISDSLSMEENCQENQDHCDLFGKLYLLPYVGTPKSKYGVDRKYYLHYSH